MTHCRLLVVSIVLAGFRPGGAGGEQPPKLPHAEAHAAGMDAARLDAIDGVVAEGLRQGRMPGCVVLVGRHGKVVFLRAYGYRQVEPDKAPMTTDTLFDLASLTKPIATATSVMRLVEQGSVALDDPVARHVPEFGRNGKQHVTVEQLLLHQGGLVAANSLRDYRDGPEKAIERICELPLHVAPGTRFVYSDVGYIVLAEMVHRVAGCDLDAFSREQIFRPLGIAETGFLPSETRRQRTATTEQRDGRWMQGEVHDPRAHLLEGIAGHAGLFATAEDLAVYAQMLLGSGEYAGVRVLKPETVATMTTPRPVSSGRRALGWDVRTGYSSSRGERLSERAFGHGGFTGTVLWIDPELDLFLVFLSNRVHPDGKGAVNPLAGKIAILAASAIDDSGGGASGGEASDADRRPIRTPAGTVPVSAP